MVDLLKHEHDKARLKVFVRSSSAEPNEKYSLAPSLTLDLCDCGSIPPLRGNEAKREAYLCSCCITPSKVVLFFLVCTFQWAATLPWDIFPVSWRQLSGAGQVHCCDLVRGFWMAWRRQSASRACVVALVIFWF